jgi:glycosyltransferase involved in cell wall biosynthesis
MRYGQATGRPARYLFTEPGLGQARNTNQGLAAARGELVRILHSDDILHPGCLAWECAQFSEFAPLTLLFQDCIPFSEEAAIDWNPDPLVRLVEPYRYFEDHLSTSTALPSGTVFRREALEAAGGMRPDWSFLCDWELFAKLLLDCGRRNELVAHASAGLFGWRLHEDSTTSMRWRNHFTEHAALMDDWRVSLPGEHEGLFEDDDVRAAFFAGGEAYRLARVFDDCEKLGWTRYLAAIPWLLRNRCLWPKGFCAKRKCLRHLWRRLRNRKSNWAGGKLARREPSAADAWHPDLTLSPVAGADTPTRDKVVYVRKFDNRLNLWCLRKQIGDSRRIRIVDVNLNHLFRRSLHECLKYIQPGTEVEFCFHDNEHMTWFGLKAAVSQHAAGRFEFIHQNRSPKEGTALGKSLWAIRYRCIRPPKAWNAEPLTGVTVGILTLGTRTRELAELVNSAARHCPFPLEIIVVSPRPLNLPEIPATVRVILFEGPDEFGWITGKKNLVCREAKYSEVILCHDRFVFGRSFFESFARWGCGYGIATPKVEQMDGRRALDWPVVRGPNYRWSQGGLLRYRDYSDFSYAPGGITLIRKAFWGEFSWAEDLFWNEHEDVELSRRVQRGGEFVYLFPGKARCHEDRWVEQNPLLPYLSLGQ